MDKTAYCRDRCASSANMVSCLNDCVTRPMPMAAASAAAGLKAHSPKLLMMNMTKDGKRNMVIGSIVAVVAIGAYIMYSRKKKAMF
jgi:hypothetical protein